MSTERSPLDAVTSESPSIQLVHLLRYFNTSPAIRLIRSINAPYVIDFLYQQFKRHDRITQIHSDLRSALQVYQNRIHDLYPSALRDKPETYLAEWCSGDSRWLHRFIDANQAEPSYQLSPHTEQTIAFLEKALQDEVGFVGTESRLRLVIDLLNDLVVGSSDDPEIRLNHLRQQRDRLDAQIAEIEQQGKVQAYGAAKLREQFALAVGLLVQLQGDFRAVEEQFKELTRQVHQRSLNSQQSRGGILEYVLDREDYLKGEDQGLSFHEFVKLVHSPERQERLAELIKQLGTIEELADQIVGLAKLRGMMPMLLAEAEKILRTTQRLSVTLRRLLDTRGSKQRQRLADVLRDLQTLAVSQSAQAPLTNVGIEIETDLHMNNIFERTFWSPSTTFEIMHLQSNAINQDERLVAFSRLANLQRLDWSNMRNRVHRLTDEHGETPLIHLLDSFPPSAGVVEILGYLQIAHDDGHVIRLDVSDEINVTAESGKSITISIPQVIFIQRNDSTYHE